ncbi:trypsin-like peptidase domain-containing protein [Mollicutes bacterium LVI A0039]|nr:trypsin-like peptidase domain-containing protein [Mollicutes bacterium LVI A0039]
MKNFFISLLGGLLGGLIIFSISAAYTTETDNNSNSNIVTSKISNDNYATSVYNQSIDGVVTVLNYQSQQTIQQFLNGERGSLVESGIGSGFIYKEEDGFFYALTNTHVIDGSEKLKVIANGQSIDDELADAYVVGYDEVYDVAVIKFKSDLDLKVLEMGDSDQIQTGESVYAIGSPYGSDFAGTISAGILSAPIRKFEQNDYTYQYLQTDTAINPGNSGGPLLNSDAQVIGINSMKIADSQSDNMGFAIPINVALDIAATLEAESPLNDNYILDNYEIKRKDDANTEQGSEQQDEATQDEVTLGDIFREFFGA